MPLIISIYNFFHFNNYKYIYYKFYKAVGKVTNVLPIKKGNSVKPLNQKV